MEFMDAMEHTLKEGVVNGPTLFLTQKLVAFSDLAAHNIMGTGLPQELRTPLVGLALATLPLMLSNRPIAEKISEYTMANAIAQTLTFAGSSDGGSTGVTGPLNNSIDNLFRPIGNIGRTPTTPPTAGILRGYVQGGTRGYVQQQNLPQPKRMSGMGAGMREHVMRQSLRGMTTEISS